MTAGSYLSFRHYTMIGRSVSNSSMHATVRLLTFAILLLAAYSLCRAQQVAIHLNPDRLETFELETNQERTFFIELDKGAFAAFDWLISDDASLSIDIYDSNRQTLLRQLDPFENALTFFAPKKDRYLLVAKLLSNEKTGSHKVSLQYKASFSIPRGSRLKSSRKINGYEIRIFSAERGNDSIVAILRNGTVLGGLRASGGDTYGYYFGDDLAKAYTTNEKRGMNLIATTPDKTGDGIPDVMINYYSGGAHCCSLTYFLNLGEVVEIVELVNTSHDGLIAKQKIRNGGLVFEVGDTSWAYWPDGFASSAFPKVLLAFSKNRLTPDFRLMKKAPPSFDTIRTKARFVRGQLSDEAYYGFERAQGTNLFREGAEFHPSLYSEMLDLIYTGNEELAWQFLELAWPAAKKGKEIFLADFRKKLSQSSYWQAIKDGRGSRQASR